MFYVQKCQRVLVTAYVENCGPVTSSFNNAESNVKIFPNTSSDGAFYVKSGSSFRYQITDLHGAVLEKGFINSRSEIGRKLKSGVYVLQMEINVETLAARDVLKTKK